MKWNSITNRYFSAIVVLLQRESNTIVKVLKKHHNRTLRRICILLEKTKNSLGLYSVEILSGPKQRPG